MLGPDLVDSVSLVLDKMANKYIDSISVPLREAFEILLGVPGIAPSRVTLKCQYSHTECRLLSLTLVQVPLDSTVTSRDAWCMKPPFQNPVLLPRRMASQSSSDKTRRAEHKDKTMQSKGPVALSFWRHQRAARGARRR